MNLDQLRDTPPWEWPGSAGTVLINTLLDKHAKESDRLIAAELGGELVVMNDEMAGALLSVVLDGDEPEELRATSAIGLGPVLEQADTECVDEEFEDPDSVPISLLTFRNLRGSLHQCYLDETTSKEVRRRVLEASVRSPQEWHLNAIKAAYSSGDKDWKLTAVFAMGYIRGFESQILEALESTDLLIQGQAVQAAGQWQLDAAWPHVVHLVQNPTTPKSLLLPAIEAVGNIRPKEALEVLTALTDSSDEDVAEAAGDAILMAQDMSHMEDEEKAEERDDGDWIN